MARKKIEKVEVIEEAEVPAEAPTEVPEIEPPKETIEELRAKIKKAQEEVDEMEEETKGEVKEALAQTPTEQPKVLLVPRAVSNAEMFNVISEKLDIIQAGIGEILNLAKEN